MSTTRVGMPVRPFDQILHVDDETRSVVLAALLPQTADPGTQAGFHLLRESHVGEAYTTPEGQAAAVVVGKSAWVFGEPDPVIGGFLLDRLGFRGTVAGAVSSLDPRGFFPTGEDMDTDRRRVFVVDGVRTMPAAPSGFTARSMTKEDRGLLRSLRGAWVCRLWDPPEEARFVRLLEHQTSGVIAIGGAHSLSDDWAEVAGWLDSRYAGQGLLAACSDAVLEPIRDSGRRVTAIVRDTHDRALRWAAKVGWEDVGEETIVRVGSVRRTLRAQRLRC